MLYSLLLSSLLCIGATGEDMQRADSPFTPSKEALQALLTANQDADLFPELTKADPKKLAETPNGKILLDWALSAPDEVPQLTYTLFQLYKKTGDRHTFEAKYFKRREMLQQAAVAAWLQPDDPAHLDRVNDIIWMLCEETTWVLPAHMGPEWSIDLFNAETASLLANMVLLLGDRLPQDILDRLDKEVDRRIFQNFLAHTEDEGYHWWYKGMNNWTGVCAGSIGEATLVFEKDPVRQAEILNIVLTELDRYVKNGFEADGGCSEGPGYWGYGLFHYVGFSEMLRAKTHGKIDLLSQPKMKLIAQYPLAMYLGNHHFASFADSGDTFVYPACLVAPLAKRTNTPELLELTGTDTLGNSGIPARNLLWWDGKQPEKLKLTDVFMPISGLARLVGDESGKGIVLVAKAGHNNESHNHNDVGSFVVAADGTIYLCDPGAGLYQGAYLGEHRYEWLFTRSYGHSVPYIGEHEQRPGREYEGTLAKTGDKAIQIDFAKAYGLDNLSSLTRGFAYNPDGSLVMSDSFAFSDGGDEVQEAFMTWQEVEVDGSVARVKTDKGTLELRADSGEFTVERFDKECKENLKEGVLKRIAVTHPAAPERKTTFTMTYIPAKIADGKS